MPWTVPQQNSAMNTLVNSGISPLGSAALVSRWSNVEDSGGVADTFNSGGSGAYGIAQWIGNGPTGRITGLNAFASNYDLDPADFDTQTNYAAWEITNNPFGNAGSGTFDALNSATTPQEAADAVSGYERAGADEPAYAQTTANGIPSILNNYNSQQNPVDPATLNDDGYNYGEDANGNITTVNTTTVQGAGDQNGQPILVQSGPTEGGDGMFDIAAGNNTGYGQTYNYGSSDPAQNYDAAGGNLGGNNIQYDAASGELGANPGTSYGTGGAGGDTVSTSVNTTSIDPNATPDTTSQVDSGDYAGAANTQATADTSALTGVSNASSPNTTAGASSVPAAINAQTKQDAANQKAEDKTLAADQKASTSTSTGIVANLETYTSNLFVRAALIGVGIIFILAGTFGLVLGGGSVTQGVKSAGRHVGKIAIAP